MLLAACFGEKTKAISGLAMRETKRRESESPRGRESESPRERGMAAVVSAFLLGAVTGCGRSSSGRRLRRGRPVASRLADYNVNGKKELKMVS